MEIIVEKGYKFRTARFYKYKPGMQGYATQHAGLYNPRTEVVKSLYAGRSICRQMWLITKAAR